jgi:UDP-glucose 4-epimerase
MNAKRILITGGAGFIGTHLIKKLKKDYEVYVIDNLSNKKSIENMHSVKDTVASFFQEDIRDKEKISKIIRECKIDSCVHLAAKISVPESMVDPFTTMDVNVTGTLNVVEACIRNSVTRFVFASSAAVYGHASVLPITESCHLKPISPYGASKVAAEEIINGYSILEKLDSMITLRFFNVYGVGQSDEYAGVITKFKDRISIDLPPIIFGDGYQQRDFISVQDVVESILMALEPQRGINRGIFNIATGVPTKISDLAKLMTNIKGKPAIRAVNKEAVKGDILLSYADTSAAMTSLGFKVKRDLETGLQEFIQS